MDDIEQRLRTYLNIFEVREERILNNIKEGYDTIEKLAQVPTIYPRIPHDLFYIFEEIMLEKHLELMVKENVVNQNGNRFDIIRG